MKHSIILITLSAIMLYAIGIYADDNRTATTRVDRTRIDSASVNKPVLKVNNTLNQELRVFIVHPYFCSGGDAHSPRTATIAQRYWYEALINKKKDFIRKYNALRSIATPSAEQTATYEQYISELPTDQKMLDEAMLEIAEIERTAMRSRNFEPGGVCASFTVPPHKTGNSGSYKHPTNWLNPYSWLMKSYTVTIVAKGKPPAYDSLYESDYVAPFKSITVPHDIALIVDGATLNTH